MRKEGWIVGHSKNVNPPPDDDGYNTLKNHAALGEQFDTQIAQIILVQIDVSQAINRGPILLREVSFNRGFEPR